MSDLGPLLVAALVFPGGLFALSLGLLLKGLDRKLIARLQARIGPPVAQPFFDVAKLLRKQTLIPHEANTVLFLGAPVVGCAAMLFALALIPLPGFATGGSLPGDLILLLYLSAVPGIAIMIAGSASGSVYGALGFSREMSLVLAYEGPLLFAMVAVALFVGHGSGGFVTLSLHDIVAYQRTHGANIVQPVLWPAFLAYLACLPATLGIPPFDIAEAETEVLEGPLIEYSGPPLALLQVMQAVQRVVVLALGIVLFFPNGPDGVLGVALFVAKTVLMGILAITLLRASVGRMRIDQAFLFFFTWPEAMGLISILGVLFFY